MRQCHCNSSYACIPKVRMPLEMHRTIRPSCALLSPSCCGHHHAEAPQQAVDSRTTYRGGLSSNGTVADNHRRLVWTVRALKRQRSPAILAAQPHRWHASCRIHVSASLLSPVVGRTPLPLHDTPGLSQTSRWVRVATKGFLRSRVGTSGSKDVDQTIPAEGCCYSHDADKAHTVIFTQTN